MDSKTVNCFKNMYVCNFMYRPVCHTVIDQKFVQCVRNGPVHAILCATDNDTIFHCNSCMKFN